MRKLLAILVSAILAVALTILTVRPGLNIVSANSMQPALIPGDVVLCVKRLQINYGDIVVVDRDELGQDIIKRVIGLPDDRVAYEREEFTINGQKVGKDFLRKLPLDSITDLSYSQSIFGHKFEIYESYFDFGYKVDIALKKDEYFLVGDNRDFSIDSRQFGPVKNTKIRCVVKAIVGAQTDEKLHFERNSIL